MIAPKYTRKGKVGLGTYKVAGQATWSFGGFTNDIHDISEFGDEFDHLAFGMGHFGSISCRGWYDPTDESGQALIESAWKNKSALTDLRFYIDNTSYWVPDLTNDSSSAILIETYGPLNYELSGGVAPIEFSGRVGGQLVLE